MDNRRQKLDRHEEVVLSNPRKPIGDRFLLT